MDLKDFVRQTITQVLEGVADAQSDAMESDGFVNPPLSGTQSAAAGHGLLAGMGGAATIMQFDVALTAEDGKGTKGGIGVVTGLVSLGSTGESNTKSASTSRVQFSVPIQLPIQNIGSKKGNR